MRGCRRVVSPAGPVARPSGQSRVARRRPGFGGGRHPVARRHRTRSRIRGGRSSGGRRAGRPPRHTHHRGREAHRRPRGLDPSLRRHPGHTPRARAHRSGGHGARRPSAGARGRCAAGAARRMEHRGGHVRSRSGRHRRQLRGARVAGRRHAVDALEKPAVLDPTGAWVPQSWKDMDTTLAAAPLGSSGTVLVLGRPGGPDFRPSEIARLGYLAGIVATVLG